MKRGPQLSHDRADKLWAANRMTRRGRLRIGIGALIVGLTNPPTISPAVGGYDFRITDAQFDCDESLFGGGFDECELNAVVRIYGPGEVVADVFGSCEATVRYQTRDGLIEKTDNLFERFHAGFFDGYGLAQITLLFRPSLVSLDPIVQAKAVDLTCRIDDVYSY